MLKYLLIVLFLFFTTSVSAQDTAKDSVAFYTDEAERLGVEGKNNLAYKACERALRYTLQMQGDTKNQMAEVHNNLSTFAQRMANASLAQHHSREAIRYLASAANPNFETLYIAYNGIGTSMYYGSKYDSALYFYGKALETLKKTKADARNQFYRPAIIQNNLAGIYGVQGKPTEAIKSMKACIASLKNYIASPEPDLKKNSAISFQFEATDNLGGIYKEIGDFRQALSLLSYSYEQKQKQLDANDPAIFISQILLGQIYYSMREYDKARQFLDSGLDRISKADDPYLFWQADACNTLALLHNKQGDKKQAALYFEKADSLYEASLQGEYDNIYLEFLRNAGIFYAENNSLAQALAKTNKGYRYVVKTDGTSSLQYFHQVTNLSELYFISGNYKQSLTYSNEALAVVNNLVRTSSSLLDSVHVELNKPKAILLKAKSEYNLLGKKDTAALTGILNNLKLALNILEKRKSVLQDSKDISLLMANHSELLDFIKEIMLDLFSLTNNAQYADELVSLHESGIYNRIRARLDKSAALQFTQIPADIREKERSLKLALSSALEGEGTHDQVMKSYIQAEENWHQHLDQLRAAYPRYYKMRYGSIFRTVKEIQSQLPAETSIVRYFFAGKNLMAFVVDQKQQQMFRLSTENLEKNILALSSPVVLYDLYQQLWHPIEKSIRYKRVVIIPDGILFNLSFETLTAEKINRFNELAAKGLLAKHIISYQYSLFLAGQQAESPGISKNFVAFAPGFSDEIKQRYQRSTDSVEFDNSYLSLLPQPFTISLARKTQDLLGGKAFLFTESTLSSFKSNAGRHKIIHIGTHAEADNLHPEFSKLIFAKDTTAKNDTNSLYLFDIYNCDLSSNLAVLTACESGLPGYQDGEGMISLAHAFSYAGSQSIVTGLWKIDEQSSAVLMEFFYKNLLEGMPKDEALQQAKLSYLAQANGRTLAPQYWAGLVLIGDAGPVEIEKRSNLIWWVVGGIVLLFVAGILFRRFR